MSKDKPWERGNTSSSQDVVEERNALGTTESVAGAHRARFRAYVSKLGMSYLFTCACGVHFAITIVFPIRKLILDPSLKRSPSSQE